jgi:hypothetical protein
MPTIAPFDIWFPDDSSPVAPLENLFIQTANSYSSALLGVRDGVPLRVMDVADRDKKFPKPLQGTRCYMVSKDRIETYYAQYSAQNPHGSIAPGWYAAGGPETEVYLPVNGWQDLQPNQGVGLTTQIGNPQFSHGGEDHFRVNANREVTAQISGWYEVEFRLSASGPSSSDGSLKAFILRNNREWASSPNPQTVIAEDEKPSRSSRQWLNAHAPRFWMSAGDWVQLGVRTVNTTSPVRFGNMIQADLAGCFWRLRFVTPRRNT